MTIKEGRRNIRQQ